MISTTDAVIYQIKELNKKGKEVATYYELMIHMNLPGTMFADAICELARTEIIDIDNLGNIKLNAKHEKTYKLRLVPGTFRDTTLVMNLNYKQAERLAYQLNEVIRDSNLNSSQKANILFCVE